MYSPMLIEKNAVGHRSLIIDVGLDKGHEYFKAIYNGFEVVGFEANPHSFAKLREKCNALQHCTVIENPMLMLSNNELPLKRKKGQSYLINAGAGKESGTLTLSAGVEKLGALSTFNGNLTKGKSTKEVVSIVRIDDIIDEDVYLFKIDTQGFDQMVLEGSQRLFENRVVKQVIVEVDSFNLKNNGHTPKTILEYLQNTCGMVCFQTRTDQFKNCAYYGESIDEFTDVFRPDANEDGKKMFNTCWEDFLCINVEKEFPGDHPPNLPHDAVIENAK